MPEAAEDLPSLNLALRQASIALHEILRLMDQLHGVMLTSKPHDIAEATIALDEAQIAVRPVLSGLPAVILSHGCNSLTELALSLHRQQATAAATQSEEIARLLRRLAKQSAAAKHNADTLRRGLSQSMHMLRTLNAVREAGLIAEA